jgi:hypothetical protein
MGAVWLLSLPTRNASLADIFRGLGIVLMAWWSFALAGGYPGSSYHRLGTETFPIHSLAELGKGGIPALSGVLGQMGGKFLVGQLPHGFSDSGGAFVVSVSGRTERAGVADPLPGDAPGHGLTANAGHGGKAALALG